MDYVTYTKRLQRERVFLKRQRGLWNVFRVGSQLSLVVTYLSAWIISVWRIPLKPTHANLSLYIAALNSIYFPLFKPAFPRWHFRLEFGWFINCLCVGTEMIVEKFYVKSVTSDKIYRWVLHINGCRWTGLTYRQVALELLQQSLKIFPSQKLMKEM